MNLGDRGNVEIFLLKWNKDIYIYIKKKSSDLNKMTDLRRAVSGIWRPSGVSKSLTVYLISYCNPKNEQNFSS